MKRSMNLSLALFAISGSAFAMGMCPPAHIEQPIQQQIDQEKVSVQEQTPQPVIDVVFVIDTTGSMGGLIEGAKQKIWSIANQIAQAQPAPIVRMGLVGYRDRGDDYVTTMTPLTDDIDTVYADLMSYQARGGGDTPESVNEALFTAVERFDWTTQEDSLKLIYLVGDAPPKMGYKDDVKYQASCRLAYEQGINVNTIQCGSLGGTKEVWQEIAQLANGMFAAIQQDGGVVARSTPYDEQIAKLDSQLNRTMVDYGSREVKANQGLKRRQSDAIAMTASPEAAADRAVYNESDAGLANRYGVQELVNDVATGKVDLDEIEKEELPEELQSLTSEELKAEIDRRQAKREELRATIKDLAGQRAAFLLKTQPVSAIDGFDQKVFEALVKQGAVVGIDFDPEKEDSVEDTTKEESDAEPTKEVSKEPVKEETKESKKD